MNRRVFEDDAFRTLPLPSEFVASSTFASTRRQSSHFGIFSLLLCSAPRRALQCQFPSNPNYLVIVTPCTIYPAICPSIHPSIHPSVYSSIHLSILSRQVLARGNSKNKHSWNRNANTNASALFHYLTLRLLRVPVIGGQRPANQTAFQVVASDR